MFLDKLLSTSARHCMYVCICVCVCLRFSENQRLYISHIILIMCNNSIYKLILRTPNFIDEESETYMLNSQSTSQNFSVSASEVYALITVQFFLLIRCFPCLFPSTHTKKKKKKRLFHLVLDASFKISKFFLNNEKFSLTKICPSSQESCPDQKATLFTQISKLKGSGTYPLFSLPLVLHPIGHCAS